MANRDVIVCANAQKLADTAAEWFVERLRASSGRLAVALAGGSTPKRLYERLSQRDDVPWERIHWFWGDERFVLQSDPRSNTRMVRDALLNNAPIPSDNIHPVPTETTGPESSALAYEAALKTFYGADKLEPKRPLFDIVLLGLGSDGHTASLFPGTSALTETTHWTTTAEAGLEPFVPRVTLTFPTLGSSRAAAFLVSGADKKEMLARIFAGEDFPAGRVTSEGTVTWFIDTAAVGDQEPLR